mgnify:CR=1 FL=1
MRFLIWVAERLKEPSTWAGLTVLLTTAGLNIDPELWKEIGTVSGGLAGLILIVTKETK